LLLKSNLFIEKCILIDIFRELLAFLRFRKKLWLAPIIIVMGLVGWFLMLAQGSVFAPFIYTLF